MALRAVVAELMNGAGDSAPSIRVVAQGTPRQLKPVVGDEVYRIASEALRNALRHAAAQHIAAEICYDDRQFLLRVRDDGTGFLDHAVRRDQPSAHFGLCGIRERAKKIGAGLDVWSKPGAGTEIILSIPAAVAYAPSSSRRVRAALFGTRSDKTKLVPPSTLSAPGHKAAEQRQRRTR